MLSPISNSALAGAIARPAAKPVTFSAQIDKGQQGPTILTLKHVSPEYAKAFGEAALKPVHADDGAGGRLLGGDPLSRGDQGRRHRRDQGGRRQDARNAGQRLLRPERAGARRRAHGARYVPGPGEVAAGIEVSLGLLQDPARRAG